MFSEYQLGFEFFNLTVLKYEVQFKSTIVIKFGPDLEFQLKNWIRTMS